jgi:hypothetical protein
MCSPKSGFCTNGRQCKADFGTKTAPAKALPQARVVSKPQPARAAKPAADEWEEF